MANKKKAARVSKVTLEGFREGLKEGKYKVLVGARRASSYLPDADKVKAQKLIAEHFGVSADQPGEATRGPRASKKSPKVGKKVSSRFAKNPEVAPVVAAPKVKKVRGRKAAVAGNDTAPNKMERRQAKTATANTALVTDADRLLFEIGFRGNIIDVVGRGITNLERAQLLSKGSLEISGVLQEASDTIGAAVTSVRKLMPEYRQQSEASSLPIDALADTSEDPPVLEGERPSNHLAAIAAANAAGVPVPSALTS